MIDPHVVSLTYRLDVSEPVLYQDPPPVDVDRADFAGRLENGRFVVTMNTHYASAGDARGHVDDFLRAWEISASLREGHRIAFVFEHAEVIDRAPPPPGTVVLHACGLVATATVSDYVHVRVTSPTYPSPPVAFAATPTVETLAARYDLWRQGRESLYSMAYFCETVLRAEVDGSGGTRRAAADRFAIDAAVLKKIGEISSKRGGDLEGRKAGTSPATAAEMHWLSAAIPAIILQVGAVEAGELKSRLSMESLPPLEAKP